MFNKITGQEPEGEKERGEAAPLQVVIVMLFEKPKERGNGKKGAKREERSRGSDE